MSSFPVSVFVVCSHIVNGVGSLTISLYMFQESTIGAAFFSQILSLNEATVKFDIWDTAGQERYHSLAPMYYRGAAAAVVVYDITSMVRYLFKVLATTC